MIAPQYLLDDATIELIDLNANLSKFASNTLDSYMYIKAIQTQKKAVAGPLQRTANKMTDADSSDILKRYAYLIENASDQKSTNYQWIIQMLKDNGIVEGFVEDKLSIGVTKLAERLIPLYDESIIPSSLANLTGVVSTTINLGDAVTGVKNTALKTLELKELNELIDCFKQTYREDLQNYRDVPTEDNAAKVLDDLSFIQRMRLRGETLAYKMALNQINTPLGKLLSGGYDSSAYYTKHYQNHVDAIIGASVMPISTDSIDVPKGATVTIRHNPEIGTYADVSDSNGNSYSIAEVAYRLPNGINLSTGGTLNIYSGDAVTIPYVINSGGVVALNNNSPRLGEYVQNSGTLSLAGASNKNINNLYLYGGTVSSVDSADIIVDNFASSGEATVTNAAISVYDKTTLGGKLRASLNCYGDIVGSSGYIDNLTLCGTGPQAVDGTLYPTNLLFNNISSGGITVNGTINVSGGITNTASNIKNGENTVLKNTGYINGDYYNSSLTLDGTTITAYKKFGGSLYTQGAVNIADVQIDAVLSQSNGTLNLNGNVAVKDDVYFGGVVVQSSDKTFDLKGDLTASNARLGNVNVCGKLGQTINSAVTVNNFSNNNISKSGLTLNAAVTVNGQVSSKKAPVNSKNVTLTSTASFKEPEYFGDITINGLAGSLPATLHGKLYLQGNMTQISDSIITEDIEMSAGTVTIKNAKLTGDKKIILTGGNITLENAELISKSILNTSSGTAVTIDENSKLSAMSDTNINGAITGDGQFDTYGDLQNSGTVKVGALKIQAALPVRFNGNDITVNNLITEGEASIILNNKINVLNAYMNNGAAINSGNIIFSEGNNIDGDIQYAENMNVTGDLVIDGHAVSVAENAEITGNVIIQNGGKLNVGKNFVVKNGNVTLSKNSTMTVGGKTEISASSANSMLIDATSEVELKKLAIITKLGNITVDGSLCFGSDTLLSSVNLNGNGTVSLKGDLYLSSSAVNQPDTFVLNGKAPQILSGGTMNFKNIIIENPSRKGVTFSSNATYSGELTNNNSNVSGTLNKQ